MNRKVILKKHNSEWAQQFAAETKRLTAIFQPNLVAIHHVGSTAVPGIKAKPIIDIMVVVHNIEQVDAINEPMKQLGYIAKGENGIDGRRYFRKGNDTHHTHHIHTFQDGHPEIARHLNFRDYLITHPDVALAYSRLKEELAQKYLSEPPRYTDSKTDFIRAVDEKAAAWRSRQTVETERLILHPLTMTQLQTSLTSPAQLAVELDISLVNDLFGDPVPQAISKKLEKMASLAETNHPWVTFWLIVPKETLVGVGMAGFKGVPNEKGEVEIGYGIQPAYQNRGYVTETVTALLNWALAQPECTAVTAETEIDNQSSIRVLEKAGMYQTGRGNGRLHWRKS